MTEIRRLRRLWLLLFYPAAFFLTYYASRHTDFAEWYAERCYPTFSRALNSLTGLLSFSLGELLVCALLVLAPVLLAVLAVRMAKGKGRRGLIAAKFLINILCFAGVLYFIFSVNCGVNYYRSTFAQTCGLTVKPSSKAELVALCDDLAAEADRSRSKAKTGKNSGMELSTPDFASTARAAQAAYDGLYTEYPLLTPGYSAPKPVFFSKFMSRCNITGIFFPFTCEANVNTDVPPFTIPATMCHELSHLRGYMREDEANFISYLACEKSGSADFQYSGAMLAFTYASNALDSIDGTAAGAVYTKLNDGVRQDLADEAEYWKRYEGPVAQVSTSVNNSYLKANRQSDGVQSYGRMVDLLLALRRAGKME